jgi:hypothetical protein
MAIKKFNHHKRAAQKSEIVHVTDKLANAINTLYKTGMLASVLCFVGVLMMLSANILGGELSLWLFTLGAVLTFFCLGFLLLTIIKGHTEATRALAESKDTIDAIQQISLQFIGLTKRLHTYSSKNIGRINEIIQPVFSLIDSIPIVGDQAKKYSLYEARALSQALIENAAKVEKIIEKLEEALKAGDKDQILAYSNELSEWVNSLKTEFMHSEYQEVSKPTSTIEVIPKPAPIDEVIKDGTEALLNIFKKVIK